MLLSDVFHLALPGTIRALRRNQHPLSRERVVAAMWMSQQIKHLPIFNFRLPIADLQL
jgi:hypothetical protein